MTKKTTPRAKAQAPKAKAPKAPKATAKAPAINPVKTLPRHETNAKAAALYITGMSDKAPAIRRADDLLAVGLLASAYHGAEQARVNALEGGVRALAVAIGLALPFICPDVADKAPVTVTTYMKDRGQMFGNKSGAVMRSQVNRVLKTVSLRWKPTDSSDNAKVIAEAFAFTRGELARLGSFNAWVQECPTQGTNKGKKTGAKQPKATQGPATAEEAKANLESLSPADQLKALESRILADIKALTELAGMGPENGPAFDVITRLSAAVDAAATLAGEMQDSRAKRAAKKAA